jgi:hypothetical protein
MEIVLSAILREAQTGPVIPVMTSKRWNRNIQKKAFPTSRPAALTAIPTVEKGKEEEIENERKYP